MKSAQFVAILRDSDLPDRASLLQEILDFFELPGKAYDSIAELQTELDSSGSPRRYALIAPLAAISNLSSDLTGQLHSAFFYFSKDSTSNASVLSNSLRAPTVQPLHGNQVRATISSPDPNFTGPMEGIRANFRPRGGDQVLVGYLDNEIASIVDTDSGTPFFKLQTLSCPAFITCSSDLVRLDHKLAQPWFDVRDHFLSAVPLTMFLKWALRDLSWRPSEAGACFIVDDPLLQRRYGFCDFARLDEQMQQHHFATSIAMIPWNGRRTSKEMSRLMKNSKGRLSACIHGCDHTRREFGTINREELDGKASLALQRMEAHEKETGISHDSVMVFPQGIFSPESLEVLQKHQFVAAVNTDASAVRDESSNEPLTIRESWRAAIQKHSSFPLFLRRYPSHGLENFAFDLLLGKPCLVVEHHQFFKDEHRQVIEFVNKLNSLKTPLHWRRLGEVIRRFYHYRSTENRNEIRMFANELLLTNTTDDDCHYDIQKSDAGSAGIKSVRVDGQPLAWETNGCLLTCNVTLPPGREVLIQVEYLACERAIKVSYSFKNRIQVAARRYLSEFRDNFLSRHDALLHLAQSTKAFARKRNGASRR